MKSVSIILNPRQRTNSWNSMTLPLHEVKIALRDSFSLQDNIRRVLGL
jgi:hypothetical protein